MLEQLPFVGKGPGRASAAGPLVGERVCGASSVAAVRDMALGSSSLGGRNLGLNPALLLYSICFGASPYPSWDLSFPRCPVGLVDWCVPPRCDVLSSAPLSGMWGVGLRRAAPTLPTGQKAAFAVTWKPGVKCISGTCQPPLCCPLLIFLPCPLDMASSALFSLLHVLIARFLCRMVTWRSQHSPHAPGLPF